MYKYFEVTNKAMGQWRWSAALRMLAFCSYELKLPQMGIKWFMPYYRQDHWDKRVSDELIRYKKEVLGFYRPSNKNMIWVRADLADDELLGTVAHEVLHAMQYYILDGFPEDPICEMSADEFAEFMVAKYSGDCSASSEIYLDWLAGADYSNGRFDQGPIKTPGRSVIDPVDIIDEPWFIEAARRESRYWREAKKAGWA